MSACQGVLSRIQRYWRQYNDCKILKSFPNINPAIIPLTGGDWDCCHTSSQALLSYLHDHHSEQRRQLLVMLKNTLHFISNYLLFCCVVGFEEKKSFYSLEKPKSVSSLEQLFWGQIRNICFWRQYAQKSKVTGVTPGGLLFLVLSQSWPYGHLSRATQPT